jgi:REP element-mobilizing transposase RayT
MSNPRPILAGKTYLITRRCAQREFLLRPSETTNHVFRYVLAVAAARYGIQVHAFCVMSNHVHLILTDPKALLPRFQQLLGALVARAVNASLGRWESFWAPGSYSAVDLGSGEDVVDKAAYALANPVAAGLVPTGREWPGVWSDPGLLVADPIEVRRPEGFFSKKRSTLPEKVGLALSPPPGFESPIEFRDRIVSAAAALEQKAADRLRGKFLGAARVLKQNPRSRPSSVEPRRNMRPRVAARNKWMRIEALVRLKEFVRAYRAAWAERRAGNLDAVFPAGTYLLRVLHSVPCQT